MEPKKTAVHPIGTSNRIQLTNTINTILQINEILTLSILQIPGVSSLISLPRYNQHNTVSKSN